MRNRLRAALATATATVLALAAPATPAHADVYFGSHDGAYGYAVIWDGIGWTGAAYPLPNQSYRVCYGLPSWANDIASSVDNERATVNVTFYQHGGCGGASYTFYAKTDDGQLSNGLPPGQGNNSYSSYIFWY